MGGVEGPVHTAVTMGPGMAGGGQWDAGWPMQCQQNSTWREIKGRNFGPWSPPLTLRLLLRFLFFLACLSRERASPRPSPIFFRTFVALVYTLLWSERNLGIADCVHFHLKSSKQRVSVSLAFFFRFPWGAFDYGAKLLMSFCCWWWNGGGGECWDGFFLFPKVGVDPNLVVLPSSWATVVYVFSSAAAAAAFLPMQGSMKLRIGRTPPQQQLNLRIELWKV